MMTERKILFLDWDDIDYAENLRHVINPARLSDEPILPLGSPGSFDAHRAYMLGTGVLREPDNRFRMWYWGMSKPESEASPFGAGDTVHIGYAESCDGLVWHKPSLGLTEYRGSKDNNIVRFDLRAFPGGMSVCRDESAECACRYKALASHHQGAVCYVSRDGWDWQSYHGARHVYQADPQSEFCNFTTEPYCLLYDPGAEEAFRWKSYGQGSSGPLWGWQRRTFYAYSPDALHWTLHPQPVLGNPLGQPLPHVYEGQVHGVSVIRLGSVLVFFCDYGFTHPRTGRFTIETRLAVSRDGVNLTSYFDRGALVALPHAGHWAGGGLAAGGVAIAGDEIILYVSGLDDANGWAGGPDVVDTGVRLGAVHWPVDGLCHVESREDTAAWLLTKSMTIKPGQPLSLEITAAVADSLKKEFTVSLFDGKTLKPLGVLDLCHDVVKTCSHRQATTYSFKTITEFPAEQMKLRLQLPARGKLYSIMLR